MALKSSTVRTAVLSATVGPIEIGRASAGDAA
jgi:hypothetical protein